MRRLVFAANWKMHFSPGEARAYLADFLPRYEPRADRAVWFFPSAIAVESVVQAVAAHPGIRVGVQDVHWEPKGAFTGALSAPMAARAGARAALAGHSERRHVFGESDEDTGRKVRASLAANLTPVLCVGERLEERDAGQTLAVVVRQLAAGLDGIDFDRMGEVVVAYEPVWAIGTGRNATPSDAASIHRGIRRWLRARGATAPAVLYGGSVNRTNISELLAERELDGVLVGGASLDPEGWAELVQTQVT
jgi:triosephosphate isomerase